MMRISARVTLAALLAGIASAMTLIPGDPGLWFPNDTPQSCLAALNTTLNCDSTVQLLNTPVSYVGWNTTGLTNLCTTDCYSSLVYMKAQVTSACNDFSPDFNGMPMNVSQILDFYIYKYNYNCLKGIQYFCLVQDYNWNIPSMIAAGGATWPKYTNKTYPDWSSQYAASCSKDLLLIIYR